jgi:hypothetical protein
MTKRLRAALLGLAFVGTLGLAACDSGSSGAVPLSPAQDAINIAFGPTSPQATRVAHCESTLDPAAVSRGGGNWGLFQINRVHAGQFEAVTGQPWSVCRVALQPVGRLGPLGLQVGRIATCIRPGRVPPP